MLRIVLGSLFVSVFLERPSANCLVCSFAFLACDIITGMIFYQSGILGYFRASLASMPHFRPAQPTIKLNAAIIGISNSQIHAVPHSDIQSELKKRKAASATGRVSSPSNRKAPKLISVTACKGPATVAWAAAKLIMLFQKPGAWPFST